MKAQVTKLALAAGIIITTGLSAIAAESTGQSESSVGLLAKERFKANYANYVYSPTFNEADGGIIFHYFDLGYKATPNVTVSAVFAPLTNFSNALDTWTMDDSFLKLSYSPFYKNGNTSVFGQLRYYVPMAESSKLNTNGKVQGRLYVTHTEGQFEFTSVTKPTFYLNKFSSDGKKTSSISNVVEAKYRLLANMTLDLAFEPVLSMAVGRPERLDTITTDAGFTAELSENLSISPFVEFQIVDPKATSTQAAVSLSYTLL